MSAERLEEYYQEFVKKHPDDKSANQFRIWLKIKLDIDKKPEKIYFIDEVKTYAFWAVQYVSRLKKNAPDKMIKKADTDHYIEFELGVIDKL